MIEKVFNTYGQLMAARRAGLPDVGILTKHSQGCRTTYRDGWSVVVPGKDISEGQHQHWSENVASTGRARLFHRWDHKDCATGRERDAKAFLAAVEWCKTRFPVQEWARNRMGDFVDVRVNKMFPLPKRERRASVEETQERTER